ncbi:TIM barrel protein [Thalassoglobus sp. JC818]|uniref:sugar phosphate isomerase/epimerase family protein n=1 Tax=Thalassoglobus sp. JC818 TaxID=3232136 RepID=UPI00345A8F14
MYVAASTRCFGDLDYWQSLTLISDHEFDKVEIYLDETGALPPSKITADPNHFYHQMREKTRLAPIAFTLAHEIPIEQFEKLCSLSKLMQVTQINVATSPVGTPFNSEIDRLKAMARAAATEGIRVGIRTEAGTLSADAHTAVELCQAVSGLGIAFDPSYFVDPEKIDQIVDLVAKYTMHVFLRDSTREQLQVQVGLGEVDYGRIISQLEKHRYSRALSVELLPNLMEQEQRTLELRKLRMLIDSLL